MKSLKFALAALALAISAPASGGPVKAGDLTIENAWARATPKGSQVGAGYLTIRNDGGADDRLTGVSVDFAAAQVHEMKMDNGVMQMREVADGVNIPAHQSVTLAPGGLHIMFIGLKHALTKGESVKATLTFARSGQVSVDLPVAPIGATGPGGAAHDMKGMKM